ncbi:MAG TPA: hypothetical protein VME19_00940 [Streptosporangiaceae bacterium]|nr:hypothetical protein [Streptosporangiaceae bacterium]
MENAASAHSAASAADAVTARDAAPAAPAGPVWRFLLMPRWLAWHLLMVVSFWGMLWLGDWQLHRALGGNGLSWAYTFEWPLFAGFAVVFWAKTIRDEFRIKRGVMPSPDADADDLPAGVAGGTGFRAVQVSAAAPGGEEGEEEDEELSAYNAYLAKLNAEVKRHGRWHGLG